MWLSGRVLTHLARTWVWLQSLPPHENIHPTTLITILFTTEISLKGQMPLWVEDLRRGLGEVHDTYLAQQFIFLGVKDSVLLL